MVSVAEVEDRIRKLISQDILLLVFVEVSADPCHGDSKGKDGEANYEK